MTRLRDAKSSSLGFGGLLILGSLCHTAFARLTQRAMGGTEEHVQRISDRLASRFSVTVCTIDVSGALPREEVVSGVKIEGLGSWAPSENYFFWRANHSYIKFDLT